MAVENMRAGGVLVLGAVNLDRIARVEAFPAPGETVLAMGASLALGGKAANQAVAAARQGAAVRFVGAVGDDADGAWLREALASDGVDVSGLGIVAAATGSAHVWVSASGENMIAVLPGANDHLAPTTSPLGPAAVRLVQLESPLAAVEAFLAEPQGALTILNAAPARWEARGLVALADILVVNEGELRVLAGGGDGDVPAQARSLIARPGQAVVVTLGARGAVAVAGDDVLVVPPVPAPLVRDTTGAGDCFCGVLADGLAAKLDLQAALRRASAAASISVTREGAAPSMPSRAEVDALLATA